MALFQTAAPAAEPLTLADIKAQLRIASAAEDNLLAELGRAAREETERQCGLALIEQQWRLTLDRLPRDAVIRLARHPVATVDAITVFGSDGGATILPSATWTADLHDRPACVTIIKIPPAADQSNGVEVDFTAGFGATGVDVPDSLKRAMLLLVAHWYEFRNGFGPGDQPVSWPAGYQRLIAPWQARHL